MSKDEDQEDQESLDEFRETLTDEQKFDFDRVVAAKHKIESSEEEEFNHKIIHGVKSSAQMFVQKCAEGGIPPEILIEHNRALLMAFLDSAKMATLNGLAMSGWADDHLEKSN